MSFGQINLGNLSFSQTLLLLVVIAINILFKSAGKFINMFSSF